MPKTTLSLQHQSNKSFELVYGSLLDFREFGKLHPCMKTVEITATAADHTTYFIKEELFLFGLLKIKPRYSAQVFEVEKNKCIQYTSQVKKNIPLSIRFTFSEINGGSIAVHENIELVCNRLVGAVFIDILRKAHRRVFENLAALP